MAKEGLMRPFVIAGLVVTLVAILGVFRGTSTEAGSACADSYTWAQTDLNGVWSGTWENHTFHSSGDLTMNAIAASGCTGTATFTGIFQQALPQSVSFTYSDDNRTTLTVTGNAIFGSGTIHVAPDGSISVHGTGAQQSISDFEGTGTITSDTIDLDYTLTFTGGSTATESFHLAKLPSLLQGDADCSRAIGVEDVKDLLTDAALTGQPAAAAASVDQCPSIGGPAGPGLWGDVDCDDDVDAVDALWVLVYTAVGDRPDESCPAIGTYFSIAVQ
jgi:hypothetical protein